MLTADLNKMPSIPTWNGNDDKACSFMEQFEAHADDNGFWEVMTNGTHLPDKASAAEALMRTNKPEDKDAIKAHKANKKGMAHMTKDVTTAASMAFAH